MYGFGNAPSSHAELMIRLRRRISSYKSFERTISRCRPTHSTFIQCAANRCIKCRYYEYICAARLLVIEDWDYTFDRNELLYDALMAHFWGPRPEVVVEKPLTEEEKSAKEKAWKELDWYTKCKTLDDEDRATDDKAWSEKDAWRLEDNKWNRIRSFERSPPVMGAFAQFMRFMEENERGIKCRTEYEVADAVAEYRDDLASNIKALREHRFQLLHGHGHYKFFEHRYSWLFYPIEWTVKEYLIQFFVLCESWRLMSVNTRGAKMWAYPGAEDEEKMVDFLGALLVHFVYMRRNGAMGFYARDREERTQDWEKWDDAYQVFAEYLAEQDERREIVAEGLKLKQDFEVKDIRFVLEELFLIAEQKVRVRDGEARDGEECFETRGQGPDRYAWMTKRMAESIGYRAV